MYTWELPLLSRALQAAKGLAGIHLAVLAVGLLAGAGNRYEWGLAKVSFAGGVCII